MGFSIETGFGALGVLFILILAVPAAIVVIWLAQLNKQVREEIHGQDEDSPVA